MSNSMEKTRRTVGLGIFSAVVIVLQIVATFVKFGPISITLALTPIVVGAALYGRKSGAWLGGVFGFVVLLMCIFGADVGGAILWNASPFFTAILCIFKGAAAGWCAGALYRALSKKNLWLGVIAAAVVSPIVNTGIFSLAMATIFRPTLTEWAGDAGVGPLYFIFAILIGVNFIIEFCVNVVLSPVVARIIRIGGKAGKA